MMRANALVERCASCIPTRADGHRRAPKRLRAALDAPPRRERRTSPTTRSARFPTANVGIAVAAPQGLVVPVIRAPSGSRIAEIARARAEVVGRARDNKLRQEDLEDGTFTISNLGMFGVEQFVAVLNPPQAAILAVGVDRGRSWPGRRDSTPCRR